MSEELNDKELQEEMNEVTSRGETLLRTMIESYKDGYNQVNPKHEIDYFLTITHHKIDTPEGKKDVAYLRLERAIRSKVQEVKDPKLEGVEIPEWQTQLVHQEMHAFRNIQERLNPNAPWKEYLYLACMYRLTAAGLEYGELLQRMKKTNMETLREESKSNIVVTDKMPAPLNPAETQYLKEIKDLRAAEGITN